MSGNADFIKELEQHLEEIEYDYNEITDELNSSIDKIRGKRS